MRSRPNAYCRLYAVGTDVVWSTKSLALPAAVRYSCRTAGGCLQRGRASAQHTGGRRRYYQELCEHCETIGCWRCGLRRRSSVAIWGSPMQWCVRSAVRLATERCPDFYQSPCLIVSVDGFWTVRVPKSRRILGLFLLTHRGGDVRRRTGNGSGPTYQQKDWRALARGKSGGWYAVAGAPSESAAVEQALQRCAEHDGECHICTPSAISWSRTTSSAS